MMKKAILLAASAALSAAAANAARPAPGPALARRFAEGPEVIGIVHWGLNTYTDREWGGGDEDPALLDPSAFDADQIVGACRAGGLGGLVIVAKHHDGFCLWPTATTDYNITRTPFWKGRGGGGAGDAGGGRDYVREMERACRRAGLRFGVYVSPWDRHDADYARSGYVEKYHAQIKELLGGGYGEVFEMWFDGANGGTGWYGGANERRTIGGDYYRFGEIFRFVRELQPSVTIFDGGRGDADFRWPGNERGLLDADSRATSLPPGHPGYRAQINTGTPDGTCFLACEADFPLRRGWFHHRRDDGAVKNAAYLLRLYLSSVGNGGTMNIGIAPTQEGIVCAGDARALAGFGAMRRALFSKKAGPGEPFNVVVLAEDLANGEQVDEWALVADGREILAGRSVGRRRMRLLPEPVAPGECRVVVKKDGGAAGPVTLERYFADPALVAAVLAADADSGETDTARWMTAGEAPADGR